MSATRDSDIQARAVRSALALAGGLALRGTVVAFGKARPRAGALRVPYRAGVTFAGALHFALGRLNR